MPFLLSLALARVEVHLDQAAEDLRWPARDWPPAEERCYSQLRGVLVFEQLTVNAVMGPLHRPSAQRYREALAKAPGRRFSRRAAGPRQARQGDAVPLARERDRLPFFASSSSVASRGAPRMRSST
jgi:hypothetical protein